MDYKTHFSIPEDIVYLNSAGAGLLTNKQIRWRQERDQVFFDAAASVREQQPAFIATVRESVAKFFDAPTPNTYLSPNFSHGLNTILDGLDPKTSFLLIDNDYPSVNFPVISRGFKHFFSKEDAQLEEHIREAIIRYKPDILLLSIVQYISGIKISETFVRQLKKEFPALLILADATQYLGTAAFNFRESPYDAIGASGYKWLLAGFGNGFFLLKDQLKEQLYTEAQKQLKPHTGLFANKEILSLYFEPGHIDSLAQGTLQQGLEFISSLGIQAVQQHIQALSTLARESFAARNLLEEAVLKREEHSNIFNLQIAQQHFEYLMQAGIRCFPRGNGIRVAFHLYNDQADLHKLLTTIDQII